MTTWHKILITLGVLLVIAVLLLIVPHLILGAAGVYPIPVGTSPWYQFWSGVGLSLVISGNRWLFSSWHKDQCHVDVCHRLGRYPTAGGMYYVCRKHHPHEAVRTKNVTVEHIHEAHENFLREPGTTP